MPSVISHAAVAVAAGITFAPRYEEGERQNDKRDKTSKTKRKRIDIDRRDPQ
jgi:hypothetical protein